MEYPVGKKTKTPVRAKAFTAVTGALLTTLLVFSFVHSGQAGSEGADEPGHSKTAPAPEVETVTVREERVVLTSELPGRTSPYLMAEIRPQVGGLIQKRLFTEGADVREGQALYEIDSALFQAAVDNAQANLAAARKGADLARAAIEVSQAGVEQQRAILALALSNSRRFTELAEDGAVSLFERDQAVTEAQVASATLRSALAHVTSNRAAVEAAQAAIQQAEAAAKTTRINLGYTRITTPISGRIGKSNVTVGALVTAHQPLALATVQQLDPIYVDVRQSSAELLRLRHRLEGGQIDQDKATTSKVQLILEDNTSYPMEGTLEFRDVTVDQATGSVVLRVAFPNPRGILLPGMFVRAVIREGIDEKAILISQQAVSRDPRGNPLALIVDATDTVEQRTLSLDRAIGNQWLVTSGLAPGDRVIVEGSQRVRPGSSVRVLSYHAETTSTSKTISTSDTESR
ncbi:efflux RND transporter periplasmic adaptor subunit [bacterium]|nr:efflux RND transporter periplasmic adaptor subunit [bacterium]